MILPQHDRRVTFLERMRVFGQDRRLSGSETKWGGEVCARGRGWCDGVELFG